MKLDRNIEGNEGRGKYAILNLRKMALCEDPEPFGGLSPELSDAITLLEDEGILEWGDTPETDFFLIKLKDKHARGALMAYAASAMKDDKEFAGEVLEMANRSGHNHPLCRKPD